MAFKTKTKIKSIFFNHYVTMLKNLLNFDAFLKENTMAWIIVIFVLTSCLKTNKRIISIREREKEKSEANVNTQFEFE